MNNVNAVQRKVVDDMRNELLPMPKNRNEVAQLLIDTLLAVDHVANEKEFMDKCLSKVVRTYFSLEPKEGGGVYLSRLKNQMIRLNYFQTLNKMAGARNEDGFKMIYRHLISLGVASSNGIRITMSEEAKSFVEVISDT